MKEASRDNRPSSSSDSTRETRETGKVREGSPPLRVITLTKEAVPSSDQNLASELDRLARLSGQPEATNLQEAPLTLTETVSKQERTDEEEARMEQWAAAIRASSSSYIAGSGNSGEGTTEAHPTPRQKPENLPDTPPLPQSLFGTDEIGILASAQSSHDNEVHIPHLHDDASQILSQYREVLYSAGATELMATAAFLDAKPSDDEHEEFMKLMHETRTTRDSERRQQIYTGIYKYFQSKQQSDPR